VSAVDVIRRLADEIAATERWRIDRDLRRSGEVFSRLIELGGRMYGPGAVALVERHLRGQIRSGQLQHWAETDRNAVVVELRAAAQAAADREVSS